MDYQIANSNPIAITYDTSFYHPIAMFSSSITCDIVGQHMARHKKLIL